MPSKTIPDPVDSNRGAIRPLIGWSHGSLGIRLPSNHWTDYLRKVVRTGKPA